MYYWEVLTMKGMKATLSIAFLALLIVGVLAVLGHAKKPLPPPDQSKSVTVSGAINGLGEPSRIAVSFDGSSFIAKGHAGLYVANPDGGLTVLGTRKGPRTLRYRYCYAISHDRPDYCDNPDHDPSFYRALRIYDGTLEGKGGEVQIVWPAGSIWEIYSKEPFGALVDAGVLATEVIYREAD